MAAARNLCLVTGVAGFIGSHLAEALLAEGHRVRGADSFTGYYDRRIKEANLSGLSGRPGFELIEADLAETALEPLLDGVGLIFHEAGQPGVRASWGADFADYVRHNLLATQRLLEACRGRELERFVFASSSSIYGDAEELPIREESPAHPVSPYGVTKLAAEQLVGVYSRGLGIPGVSLRYFTVYGPRQRPDMAFNRFLRALLEGRPLEINGDGEQTRDFTYVADAVNANLLAARSPLEAVRGRAYNIAGGSRVSVNQVIEMIGRVVGREPAVVRGESALGDARHTFADTAAARRDLGFAPNVGLEEGLRAELEWTADMLARQPPPDA